MSVNNHQLVFTKRKNNREIKTVITNISLLTTGHLKNNDSEFSERLRGAEIAVYVNVCQFEIFNCY